VYWKAGGKERVGRVAGRCGLRGICQDARAEFRTVRCSRWLFPLSFNTD